MFGDTHGPNKIDFGEIPCKRKLSFLVFSFSQGHYTQNKREQFDPINIFNIFSISSVEEQRSWFQTFGKGTNKSESNCRSRNALTDGLRESGHL